MTHDGRIRKRSRRNRTMPPEIVGIEALIRAGHADLEGLCMALSDWSEELRLLEAENKG